MDDLDERLLRLLKDDARRPFVEIARELGTSEGTIRQRVKKLGQDGTIRRFTVKTAGRNVKAMIEVAIETNARMADVSNAIAKWDGVESVWEVSGDFDIVVVCDVASTAALNEIVDKIRAFGNVRATRSRLIMKEL